MAKEEKNPLGNTRGDVSNNTISYLEMVEFKKNILDTIDKNIKIEDGDDVSKGYNMSLTDIKKQVEVIQIPSKDITSLDKEYLDTLEKLYLLGYLKKTLDGLISAFKILEKVENNE